MKRIVLLLVLMCLLSGCSSPAQETTATVGGTAPLLYEKETPPPAPAEDGLIRSPEEETETEPAPPAPGQHQAAFSILENDHSIRNDSGDILVKIQYEQVILDTANAVWKNINEGIQEDYRGFLADMAYLNETAPEDWEKQLQDMGTVYGSFISIRSADVTHNSGGIFSIRTTQEWFMRGVYNQDYYGLNFDLTTGEALPLSRLSDLSEEDFLAQLKTIVCEKLEENRDALLDDPAVILQDYTLEDFSFCLEEGELVLLFPTYTFGPGVLGATEVSTGLYPVL